MLHTRVMSLSPEHPNGIVPSIRRYRTGVRGGLTARGLQRVWDALSRTEHRDAMALADSAALALGIKPASVRSYVYALAAEGHLVSQVAHKDVRVTRGGKTFTSKRKVTWYRIASVRERAEKLGVKVA